MDPLTAGVISGGANIAGTYLGNHMAGANAMHMMDFQERMSGSAHQREVEDLRKAGLNPILSALGAGASSGPGAQAPVSDFAPGISKGMDTAIAIKQQNKDFQQKDAQIENTEMDSMNKKHQAALLQNQAASTAKETEQKGLQNYLIKETMNSAIKKARAEGDYSEINQIMGIINSGAGAATQLVNPLKWITPKK